MNQQTAARLKLIVVMLLFGTIGIFVRTISMPSSIIALVRGIIGSIFLLLVVFARRTGIDMSAVKRNWWKLLLSGGCIGVNWILLFEAYRFTTVATATLCYYLQPVIVVLGSALVLKEKLSIRKLLCVLVAILGMIPVSGVLESIPTAGEVTGILLATGAALLYGINILTNKTMQGLSPFDMTIFCMITATLTLLPYTLLTEDWSAIVWEPQSLLLLLVVGIIHTGVAYALYYSALEKMKAQEVAIYGYIDPICAILLSALLLSEPLTVGIVIGAVMILGATYISERKNA
ncbi:MAG: EamA/RhaT family transporter [Ruminococcaceae bacterium]|nr:EamA/RhaT family transporter [Oscillospiraceae bacterium]